MLTFTFFITWVTRLFSNKVSHALAYVTASKSGVSEPEIEDFISLDDKVEIFFVQFWEWTGFGRHLPIPSSPHKKNPTSSLDEGRKSIRKPKDTNILFFRWEAIFQATWQTVRLTECVSIEVYEISALSILFIGVINYYHKQFKHAAKKRLDHIFGNPDGRWPGISWTTRTTSTSTPTCPTTSSAPTEEVDFPFLSTFFPLRHPQAFPLHRDPEAHLSPEEQGRQQRQTSGNGRKKYNLMCLIRCLPCLWPITTDRESWQGAWPCLIFLFRTSSTFHLTLPPTYISQVQPEEVHRAAFPGDKENCFLKC